MDKIWLSSHDIQAIMGCKSTKASDYIKRCNDYVKKNKPEAIMPGRGKTYLKAFCKLTGTTKEEIWSALRST